jgi:hypothetical protein
LDAYRYAENNPVVFTDASGLCSTTGNWAYVGGVLEQPCNKSNGKPYVGSGPATVDTNHGDSGIAYTSKQPKLPPITGVKPARVPSETLVTDGAPTLADLDLPVSPVTTLPLEADRPWRERWNKYAESYNLGRTASIEAITGAPTFGSDGESHYTLLITVPNDVDLVELDLLLRVRDSYAGRHEYDELVGDPDFSVHPDIHVQMNRMHAEGSKLEGLLVSGTISHLLQSLFEFATSRVGRPPKPRGL